MPRKGFYTQGLAILLRKATPLQAIEESLQDFDVVKRLAESSSHWAFAGPSVVVAYRPDVNGYVAVDTIDHQWPDHMGDPKAEPEVFGAWSMGHFGPGAWPGSLERACQHSWGWPDGRSVPLQHQALIRVRSSYVFGADDNAPVMPSDYNALQELEFLTRIAAALVRLPEVLCFFNPNGECVRSASQFLDALSQRTSAKEMPLDVWSNVRFFRFEGTKPEWALMDTVGLSQLDASDHEACFPLDAYSPSEIDNFLKNVSAYVVEHGPVIRDGDTVDGPGNAKWQGFNLKEGRIGPPREVIRWFPLDGQKIPVALTQQIKAGAE
jgi:hypothetical protein